jgi:lysophospholipase L1-like esterase
MYDPQSGAPVHKDVIDMYNQAIGTLRGNLHAKRKRLVIADMHTNVTHDMLSDGIHPNDRGYAHMASVWFASIASHLP